MPQKLADGYALKWEPKLLRKRPEHALGIALVASEWTALENQLIFAFTFCMFAMHGTSATSGRMAQAAWYSLDSLPARLKLLTNIARDRLSPDQCEAWKKLQKDIRSRADERNRVVHGHWLTCDKYPADLILRTPHPDDIRIYTVRDFDQITDRIIETSNQIATFWHHIEHLTRPEIFRELERALQQNQFSPNPPTEPDKNPSPSEPQHPAQAGRYL